MNLHGNKSKNEMLKIYKEFGIDIHQVPVNLQSQLNAIVKEVIKLRAKIKNSTKECNNYGTSNERCIKQN